MFNFEKNAGAILIGLALNVYIAFGSIDTLTIFFQSMSMEYFSIFLCLLQFPSEAFYSFQHTDLLHLRLSLFLGILWVLVQL